MAAADGTSGFDWDVGDRRKCQKHGLTVADVEHVMASAETLILPVAGMKETRFIGIGRIGEGRGAFVVFTIRERNGVRLHRPISARHMHEREARKYEQALAGFQKR